LVDFKPKIFRPVIKKISNDMLLCPLTEFVVEFASFECYLLHSLLLESPVKDLMLENIGVGKYLIRRVVSLLANQECGQLSGEDDLLLANSQAELRLLREDLSRFNFFSLELNLDPDKFLDYLVNCIRNDVLSVQRYFSLTRSKYKKNCRLI
jgi:hypothetical protein